MLDAFEAAEILEGKSPGTRYKEYIVIAIDDEGKSVVVREEELRAALEIPGSLLETEGGMALQRHLETKREATGRQQ